MFGDTTILMIWCSLNLAIMMVTMLLWHISKLCREMSCQESTVVEKRPDRRS